MCILHFIHPQVGIRGDNGATDWARLIRSHSKGNFCLELSGIRINSKY